MAPSDNDIISEGITPQHGDVATATVNNDDVRCLDAAGLESASREALARTGWNANDDGLMVGYLLTRVVTQHFPPCDSPSAGWRDAVVDICKQHNVQAVPRLAAAIDLWSQSPFDGGEAMGGLCKIAKALGDAASPSIISLVRQALAAGRSWDACLLQGFMALPPATVADLLWEALTECRDSLALAETISFSTNELFVERVISALGDPDSAMRWRAVRALGILKHSEKELLLCKASRDQSPTVRAAAAGSLAGCRDDESAKALEALLADPDADVRFAAAVCLLNRGDRRGLGLILDSITAVPCDRSVWKDAINALADLGSPLALDVMRMAAADPDARIRRTALEGLAKIGDRNALEILIAATEDSDKMVQDAAIDALTAFPYPEVTSLLYKLVIERKQWHAADALAKIKNPLALDMLMRALEDRDVEVREHAADALAKTASQQVVDALIHATRDTQPCVRNAAVKALGKIGDKRAVAALVPMLLKPCEVEIGLHPGRLSHTENSDVRGSAANALHQLGWVPETDADRIVYLLFQGDRNGCAAMGAGVIPKLIALLHQPDEELQVLAHRALDQLIWKDFDGEKHTDKPMARNLWLGLLKACESDSLTLAAILVFWTEGNKTCEDALRGRLREAHAYDDRQLNLLMPTIRDDPRCADEVITVLANIGDEVAVDCLLSVLESSNRWLSRKMCVLLGQMRNERATSALLQAAESEDAVLAEEARAALIYTSDIRALPWADKIIKEGIWQNQYFVYTYLARIGLPAVDTLLALLKRKDSKPATSLTLLAVFPSRMVEPLIEALETADGDTRNLVEFALALITGVRFNRDPELWRAWWKENKHRLVGASQPNDQYDTVHGWQVSPPPPSNGTDTNE